MFHAQARNVTKITAAIAAAVLSFVSMSSTALAIPAFYTVIGNENMPGVAASQCLATDASNNIVTTGFACGSGSGTVTAVTGSGNIVSSGGTTPNITTVAAPTFAGALNAGSLTTAGAVTGLTITGTGLTPGDCLQAGTGGLITVTATACSTGIVTSISAGTNIAVTGTAAVPIVSVIAAPTFAGTVTAGNVIDSGLSINQCTQTNASKQLVSSGELCPTTFIAGTRAGGLHIETKQVTASATTPWEATVTFGAAYTVAPLCTATSINATPLVYPVDIVSESTTTAVIFDGSLSAGVFNVICIGF